MRVRAVSGGVPVRVRTRPRHGVLRPGTGSRVGNTEGYTGYPPSPLKSHPAAQTSEAGPGSP